MQSTPLTHRERTIVRASVAGGATALFVHVAGLYSLNSNVDSVAHYVAGFSQAGLVMGLLSACGMDASRKRASVILGWTVCAVALWELLESLPVVYLMDFPITLGYHTRWFTDLYINDTTADMALGLLGAFTVVWLVAYPDADGTGE